MTDTNQTESNRTQDSSDSGDSTTKSCCGDFEGMFQLMQKFCGNTKRNFDCSAIIEKMQKMCCGDTK